MNQRIHNFLTRLLRWSIKKLARLTIWRFRPGIIGITGSVGKTSAKIAVGAVLGAERHVRVSAGNLNNELGLPLAILGNWRESDLRLVSRDEPEGERRFWKTLFWLKVLFGGVLRLVFGKRANYPEILILEYGADRPGDIRRLMEIARPNIGVITAVGEVPVHIEYYPGPREVAREKGHLIEWLPAASFAVLNHDDPVVLDLGNRTRAHLMTFGSGDESDIRITAFEHRVVDGVPVGIAFKLEYGGNAVPVRIDGVFGRTHAMAAAAATCIGLIFGLNLIKISEALRRYRPAPGRSELARGIRSSWVIDDTYNASPLSMIAALDTLRDLPGKRKIAILGDMLEIGAYALQAHERIGKIAAKFADVLVTVGPAGKLIADAAKAAGMKKKNIFSFDIAEDAVDEVTHMIKKDDLVLVKASHAMRLELIVEGIKAAQSPI